MADTPHRSAPQPLGEGFVLRHATAADTDALSTFNGWVHGLPGEPNPRIAARTREHLEGRHPHVGPEDFLIVTDEATGAIVSTLGVMRQRWSYEGIPLAVEQIEFVATDPAYRRRGLVRQMFERVHQEGAARGVQLQVINGIPNYYRQFGYALALAMGGGRRGPRSGLPAHPAQGEEAYRLRPATPADLPFIATTAEMASRRYLISPARDAALWRYELDGRSELNIFRRLWQVIETGSGEPVGYLAHTPQFRDITRWLSHYELRPGVSWLAATPSVLRQLAALESDGPPAEQVGLWLGLDHPAYRALPRSLAIEEPADAWYVRITDPCAFLRQIAPVLESRLAASIAAGHSGSLRLNLFRTGIVLAIADGQLRSVEPWERPEPRDGDATFPEHCFTQLLCGYRSLPELLAADADCTVVSEEAEVLLGALFPKRPSFHWITG